MMVVAACGELVEPEAFSPSTTEVEADGVEQETASQIQEQPEVTVETGGFVPTPDPDYVPTLLISSDRYVIAVDETGSAPLTGPLQNLRTVRVVDDLVGGVVTQELNGPIIYRQAQGEPEVLYDSGSRLLDVGFWDGSPRAFVDIGDGQVERVQLADRTGSDRIREPHLQLPGDDTIVSFSASRDIQAVIVENDRCGELLFFNADGQPLDFPGPAEPECVFRGRPVYGAVALSPDGDAVAYTIVSYRGDGTEEVTELVARELVAGSGKFFERRIGEGSDAITSLAFDGERAAYLKVAGESYSVTLLDLAVDSAEVPVDLLNGGTIHSVSFARIPVTPVE